MTFLRCISLYTVTITADTIVTATAGTSTAAAVVAAAATNHHHHHHHLEHKAEYIYVTTAADSFRLNDGQPVSNTSAQLFEVLADNGVWERPYGQT